MLTRLGTAFTKIVAVEPSPSALQVLKKRVGGRRVRILEGKAEAIPLPSKSVDIAFAKSSFHHFGNTKAGLGEMRRIAKKAIVVVEVIAPSTAALKFAQEILPQKEPGRTREAVFSEADLKSRVEQVAADVRCLHFDQYIDVKAWLTHSDLDKDSRLKIYRYIAGQSGAVKEAMQIHFQKNRLMMLRRMALVIGLLA